MCTIIINVKLNLTKCKSIQVWNSAIIFLQPIHETIHVCLSQSVNNYKDLFEKIHEQQRKENNDIAYSFFRHKWM